MKPIPLVRVFLVATVLGGMTACQQQPQQALDALAADEAAIHKAYAEWVQVTNAKDIQRWVSFAADDAIFFPANHPILTDKDAIQNFYSTLFADPNFTIACKQTGVAVSKAGDLAWSMGTCEVKVSDSRGNPVTDTSKWVKVWKKQPSGSWKCIINMWNSDGAPLAATD